VTLRDQQAGEPDVASLMDPATRSLADALKITYRLLQVAMVGMGGLFLMSGFQAVKEGEKGIRLVLGKVESDDLPPGFQFTLPEPFGEIIKVSTGNTTVKLDREFFPNLPEDDRNRTVDQLKGRGRWKLDPASDGSLITADFNIAHARVNVTYRRERVVENARNINPEDETRIVKAAVSRGVVHATAGVSIDELLKLQPDEKRRGAYVPVAEKAKAVAQQTLDQLGAGIKIADVAVVDRTAPLTLIGDFEKVQTNESNAKQEVEKAGQDRVKALADAAGREAAEALLKLIDRYDRALLSGDQGGASAVLGTIDRLMDGQSVEVDGETLAAGLISGEVSKRLSAAREYRSSVVSRAAADASLFAVKRDAYAKNPQVVVTGDWSEAFSAFMARDQVELFLLPPGTRMLELSLNRDPELMRSQEIKSQRSAAEKRAIEENTKMQRDQFETITPGKTVRGD
jgi:membrane protease subunit HflK